jgi:hypothetical protein
MVVFVATMNLGQFVHSNAHVWTLGAQLSMSKCMQHKLDDMVIFVVIKL